MGAVVVFISIGFLLSAIFDADQRDQLGAENWPVLLGSLVVIGLGLTWCRRRSERRSALGWSKEGREPNDEESRPTLAPRRRSRPL